jgi:hypothetical protein
MHLERFLKVFHQVLIHISELFKRLTCFWKSSFLATWIEVTHWFPARKWNHFLISSRNGRISLISTYLMIDLSKYYLCTFLGKDKGRSHYDTRKPKSITYFSILVMICIQIGLYIFSLKYRATISLYLPEMEGSHWSVLQSDKSLV